MPIGISVLASTSLTTGVGAASDTTFGTEELEPEFDKVGASTLSSAFSDFTFSLSTEENCNYKYKWN